MVLKHNKRFFADDEPYQFAYKHSWQVNCSSELASFAEIPPYRSIPEKPPPSDEEVKAVFNQSQGEERTVGDDVIELSVTTGEDFGSRRVDDHSENDPGSISSLSWVTSSTDEDVVRSEHNKRSPRVDESHLVAYKRARQVDRSGQLLSFELFPFNTVSEKPPTKDGEGEEILNQSQEEDMFTCDTITGLSVAASKELNNRAAVLEKPTVNACGSMSSLSWVTCSTSEEQIRSELPIRISFSPHFIEDDYRANGLIQPEEIYTSRFDYYSRKHVAVGPDQQADIPVWSPRNIKSSSRELDPGVDCHQLTGEDNSEKFMGTCVVAMPDVASAALGDAKVGAGRSDCSCPDEGSIRCVRQHVTEAREKLKRTLGQVKLLELGFCDMGEYVVQKWTEEEEHAFHEVVFANPASMGKNFWDHLPQVFPSQSSKDLVSYYFNVFVLRKRAEQNRSDPLNVDSDNDEWQESDDCEFALEDHEKDSVVESPIDKDDIYNNDGCEEYGFHEEDENGEACDDSTVAVEENHDRELYYDVSKEHINSKFGFVPRVQPMGKNLQDVVEDHDVQDDSCTSYEGQHNGADPPGDPVAREYSGVEKDTGKLCGVVRKDGFSNVMDPGYIVSPCDAKTWDLSYFFGQEKGVDFLPTCHVIEEVFGKGSWDNEARDGQGGIS